MNKNTKNKRKMKNKMKILVAAICVASGIAYFMADEMTGNKVVSDLALENINALASGEGSTNITCAQPGCIDCFGHKVKYRIEGYSLD